MTKTCPDCGKEFTPIRSSRIYCYDEQCYTIRHRRYNSTNNAKNREKERPYGKIRPYTETSNPLLADDICKGWSVQRMAKLYDRDVNDLRKHIKKTYQIPCERGKYHEPAQSILERNGYRA